ncbi:unnamed protein product, partial [Allacma fusca]
DIALETFRTLFCQRVLEKRDGKGKLIFDKFYQTITHFMGYPFWTREKHFDIKNHIVAYDYKLEGIECFDENCLKKYLPKILNQYWQNGRSFWNITLVHGYNGRPQTLVIMKWQHVLAPSELISTEKILNSSKYENILAIAEGNITISIPIRPF